ncbi:MAG: CHASE2 domain-containing protein, partial [Proteobacteria bacterium]|nr:CHASE2 domain-containing protein [Pseudomonadota bacterium]
MQLSLQILKNRVKKILPIWMICAVIIGMTAWALRKHYFEYTAGNPGALYSIESRWFDIKVRLLRGVQKPTGRVGILAIDEDSIHQFGSWPFSRQNYAQAFRNLKALGVQWIGFDAIFDTGEKARLEDVESQLKILQDQRAHLNADELKKMASDIEAMKHLSPSDKTFVKSLQEFQNIVLGFFYLDTKRQADEALGKRSRFNGLETMLSSEIQGVDMPSGRKLEDFPLLKPHGIVSNSEFIATASPHFAFFNNEADDDATNRWITLVAEVDGHLIPSLTLKTVAEYLNREIFVFFNSNGIESLALVNRDNESDSIDIPIDSTGKGR